jgi:Uri superfamily endonuclease
MAHSKPPSRLRLAACRPALADWPDAGVYQLWLRVSAPLCPAVGRLGHLDLPPGLYVYTGRAARGLAARVRRHLRGSGRKHWHIDYLLSRPEVEVVRVVLASDRPGDECRMNQAVHGQIVAPGFGASDCRARCGAHLLRVGRGRCGPPARPGVLDGADQGEYR